MKYIFEERKEEKTRSVGRSRSLLSNSPPTAGMWAETSRNTVIVSKKEVLPRKTEQPRNFGVFLPRVVKKLPKASTVCVTTAYGGGGRHCK